MAAKIGTLLDRLWKKKIEKEALEEALRKLKTQYAAIEKQIFDRFAKEEIDVSGGDLAKASLSRVVFPTLKDYEDLERFIYRNKALDLLQRRVAKGNWTDRLDARRGRKPIPGITTFEKVNLNLRKR